MEQLGKKATLDNMDMVIAFLLGKLKEDVDLTKKETNEMRMICEEVLMNIISYAYEDTGGDMIVQYDFDRSKKLLTLVFMDYGIAFDPLQKSDPDITLDIMEREVGGLGIFMIKKSVDSVEYERVDDRNTLIIKKQYGEVV